MQFILKGKATSIYLHLIIHKIFNSKPDRAKKYPNNFIWHFYIQEIIKNSFPQIRLLLPKGDYKGS